MLELDIAVDRRHFAVEVAFAVPAGERLALFGPSGAGKTTVLETVAGLVQPRYGTVKLGTRTLTATRPRLVSVPVWQRRVGLLRQQPALFPHLSVAENLAYGRPVRARARLRDRRVPTLSTSRPTAGTPEGLRALAEALDLGGLLGARPASLSGGQAQRVAICRLLLADTDVLLLDEPYGGLDARLRRVVTDLLTEAVRQRAVPAVLVAHELAEAQAFGDRLGILSDGHLLQLGEPHEVVRRPATRAVAELVGYRAFVPTGPAGAIMGVHPGRIAAGARPELGTVLSGLVSARRAAGARFEIDLEVHGVKGGTTGTGRSAVTVTAELDELPHSATTEVTVLDPPLFRPDGRAVPDQHAPVGNDGCADGTRRAREGRGDRSTGTGAPGERLPRTIQP